MEPRNEESLGLPDGERIAQDVETVITELAEKGKLSRGHILVVGASTSEVLGERIGTFGTEAVAGKIFLGVERAAKRIGFFAAYQCCEHLNRALVIEREAMSHYPLEEVAVVPVPKAGGAMAAYAFRHLSDPCVVESVQAHAGIDIGHTLIGMHLRKVAVPFRPSVSMIGKAHVTAAYTRPKYIGGPRAVYILEHH